MEDNESMEGQDLANEKKVEAFIAEIKSIIKQYQNQKNIDTKGYDVTFDETTKTFKVYFSRNKSCTCNSK